MERQKKRALRRTHGDRVKRSALEKLRAWGVPPSEADRGRVLGIRGDTFTKCSCWMCCNPRKSSKGRSRFTIQENRAMQDRCDILASDGEF